MQSLLPAGGMMSIFLMGCFDPSSQKWCTVTKCAGGHDDATLARLQTELDMVKISKVRGALASGVTGGGRVCRAQGRLPPPPPPATRRSRAVSAWAGVNAPADAVFVKTWT